MHNDFFYNENILNNSEKDYLEEISLNNTCSPIFKHDYETEDIKDHFIYPINKTKSFNLNKTNDNNKNNFTEVDYWKQLFSPKKLETEKNKEMKQDSVFFTYNSKSDNTVNIKNDKNNNHNFLLYVDDYDSTYKEFISSKNINKINEKYNYNDRMNLSDKNDDVTMYYSPLYEKKPEKYDSYFLQLKEKMLNNDYENDGKKGKLLAKKRSQNNKDDIYSSQLILHKRAPYKKRKLGYKEILFDDKCFPFKTGKGVINITTKYNYHFKEPEKPENKNKEISSQELTDNKKSELNQETPNLNLNSNEKNNNIIKMENDLYLMKFKTKEYYISEDGRKKRVKKKRKYKADIIRKKIKSRFHKTIKTIINDNLKSCGSKMYFDCLPQCFVGNITKVLNCKCLNYTYKDIIMKDFSSELKSYRHTSMDIAKYLKNLKVLNYLDKNPELSKSSGFDIIKDMKYIDLLNRYFVSVEFEDSLNQIKNENESPEYMQSYIYVAKNYVSFFANSVDNKNNNDVEEKEEDDDECEDEDDFNNEEGENIF